MSQPKERRIAPDKIDCLASDEVFVFGSNLAGKHMGGAAHAALKRFGAVWGCGVGLQGQSYAIPTMQGGVETIRPYVDQFIAFAKSNPHMKFLVTRIGCGIAGFKEDEIVPLFFEARKVKNIFLPEPFANWNEQYDWMARYMRFFKMIARLHEMGYELLRLCPSLSPSGCSWRGVLSPKKYTLTVCGAICTDIFHDNVVATNGFMPWYEEMPDATPQEDAERFIQHCPLCIHQCYGKDSEYVSWFRKYCLHNSLQGHLPIAQDDGGDCIRLGHIVTSHCGPHIPFPPAGDFTPKQH